MSGFDTRMPDTPAYRITQAQTVPRLSYYISRTNGTLVPLVPADELPSDVRLKGLPRTLNSDQVFGLQHLSSLPYTGLTFGLERDIINPSQPSSPSRGSTYTNIDRKSDERKSCSLYSSTAHPPVGRYVPKEADVAPHSNLGQEVAQSWRTRPAADPQAVIDAIVGTKSGAETAAQIGYRPKHSTALSSTPVAANAEKKEYCSYWLRTGECDYIQQGCRYKHEMPDRGTLQRLGFRNIPRWWLQKNSTIRLGSGKTKTGTTLSYSALLRTINNQDPRSDISEPEASDSESLSSNSLEVEFTPYKRKTDSKVLPATAKSTSVISPENIPVPERKQSIMSDLIDFKPLIPTPSSSISSTKSSMSEDENAATGVPPMPAPGHRSRSKSTPKHLPSKVFVPRDEDSATHITEAKKLNMRRQKKRNVDETRMKFHEARSKNRRLPQMETAASKSARRSSSVVEEP